MPRRRSFILALLAVSGFTASAWLAGSAAAAVPPSPWLQSGYNGANSNANTAERTLDAGNVGHLKFEHEITASGSNDCSGGIVDPLFSQARVYAVNGSRLVAYSLTTGRPLWQTKTDIGTDSYPTDLAVSHGRVLLGTDSCITSDPIGAIDVYSSRTGAHLKAVGNNDNGLEDMAVSGKHVVAKYICNECGENEHTVVYALPSMTKVWGTKNPAQYDAVGSAAVVGGHVFVETHGALTALDLATGKQAWRKTGYFTVVSGDSDQPNARTLVVATGSHTIAVLDPRTGRTRFVLRHTSTDQSAIAVGPHHLLAACDAQQSALCAYRISDGSRLWRSAGHFDSLTAANGLVYLWNGRVLGQGAGKRITTLSGYPVIVGSGRVGEYSNSSGSFDWYRS